MKIKDIFFLVLIVVTLNGCTTIVTAPIGVASSIVGTTFSIATKTTGAVVDMVSSDDSSNDWIRLDIIAKKLSEGIC